MGDVLTQSEIDNLLAALSNGELDTNEMKDSGEKQVKSYDFHRPSKFSKEHLRTLENMFETFGRLLSTNLPGYLRKSVTIEVANAEAVIYSEFMNALSNPVLLGVVDFSPLEGSIIIELSQNLGYTIVDRMLGGEGKPLEKSRDFTEIERVIIERIYAIIINSLIDPWANVVRLEPRLIGLETNSQFAQIISPGDTVAIITMNVKIGTVDGVMNVCIPYNCIESVIDKLNTKFWYSSMQSMDDKNYQDVIEVAVKKTRIPIRAVLGKSTISLNDLLNMQKGDIIKLNSKVEDELNVYVGNIRKFTALPGSSADSYAVKITTIIREEE